MIIEHIGLSQINGSLIVLDYIKDASYDEMVELRLEDGSSRTGRIVEIEGEKVVIQVFEGTKGLSLVNTKTRMTGHPIELSLSPEIVGRVLTDSADRSTVSARFIPLKSVTLTHHPSTLFREFIPRTISILVFPRLMRS